jgi:uncharacterized protein (TIGR00251 family)
MWYEIKDEHVIFRIKAVPASSKNMVSGILDDALKIKIKAPAVEGAANKELVKYLSKLFKVPKSSILFAGGETSKQKRLRLPLNERVREFIENLKEEEK